MEMLRAMPRAPAAVAGGLGLWDAVSIIVGIVVGAGIYETPPDVFKMAPGPWIGLGVWVVAGLLCLIGALCYAELASTYPRSGGDYVYLSRAYAPWVGFLFGWAQLAVILTGSIGMMAYVFADYAVRLWNLDHSTAVLFASLAVVILSALNLLGIRFGKGTQNVLTAAKIFGLSGIVWAAFLTPAADAVPAASLGEEVSGIQFSTLAMAMVLVFLTYGGWNDAAYVAADVRNGRRNIPRALLLGTLAVMAIYLAINAAYLWALGFDGVRQSGSVAADVLERPLGLWGARLMCLLVMISALGAVNGLTFTGSRLYATLGADYPLFAWLGRWSPRWGSPIGAIVTQTVITLLMIAAVGTKTGQEGLNAALAGVKIEPVAWEGRGGFGTLLKCTAPVFWLFFLLTAMALFVLRWKDRNVARPFTVPLYPVVPLIFCATCAYMLYSGILFSWELGLVGGGILILGLPLYWLSWLWSAGTGRPQGSVAFPMDMNSGEV